MALYLPLAVSGTRDGDSAALSRAECSLASDAGR